MTTIALRVPRSDTQIVKRLGARWDPNQRQWHTPAGRDPRPFTRWLPPSIPHDGPRVAVELVLLPQRCYRCQNLTAAVAGLLLDAHTATTEAGDCLLLPDQNGWFLTYDDYSADVIAVVCPDELLARCGAGPLRWRTTRVCPEGYLANTCRHCGTVLGNWPLHEDLAEYQAEGGQLCDLPRVPTDIPTAALRWLADREHAEAAQ